MTIKLICLGIGNGTSHAIRGIPSTSFVITIDNEPFILVDCGLGVSKKYLEIFSDKAPKYIYISHNHLDHSGELSIFILHFFSKNKSINIIGHEDVLKLVRKFRFHELYATGINIDAIANWKTPNSNDIITLENNLSFKLFKSQHSYICYGFNLLEFDKEILGYTADSGFNNRLFESLSKAPVIITDARLKGSKEHSSFSEIIKIASLRKNNKYFIVHYGLDDMSFEENNIKLLEVNEVISL